MATLDSQHDDLAIHRSSTSECGVGRWAIAKAGFTVVELVVTMAIAAILIGIGLPGFTTFIAQQNLTSDANAFIGAVAYARSESTNRSQRVSVQAENSSPDDEWGGGYCVTLGTPGNCDDALRRFDDIDSATFNGLAALDGVDTLTFDSRGLLTLGLAGQIELCSTDELENPGRLLDISLIGRVSISQFECQIP